MKGFGRLMVIYTDTQCAITAKKHMDQATLYWLDHHNDKHQVHILGLATGEDNHDNANLINTISSATFSDSSLYEMQVRVYFGQHNPINPDPASLSLQVPDLGRTLLISPPCDPSHQWQQRIESPPNKAILASDLLHALTTVDDIEDIDMKLDDNFTLDDGEPLSIQTSSTSFQSITDFSSASSSPQLETPTLQLSFQHESLPTIMIQDMDGSLLLQHQQKTNRQRHSATPRPPILT
ncbi:unnamed protein product [Absidia cylindrospora]